MSSSFTPGPAPRHPMSVSSACHRAPVDTSEAPDCSAEAPTTLEDAFKRERRNLLWYFRRKTDADEASDLVQEVYVRAAGSRQARILVNPAAFLTRIARNLLIDRARRRATNNIIVFPLDEARDVTVQPDQDLALEAAELERAYAAAIDSLPERTRRVFLMSRSENLTYRQISEELGISVTAVEYHMSRAIAIVAMALEAYR